MRILLVLLFTSTICFAQPYVKSIKDIPLLNEGFVSIPIATAKQILSSKLIAPPDTINNEWEKYSINYVDVDERGHYAYDYWNTYKDKDDVWYWDSITYGRSDGVKNLTLTQVLFRKVLESDTSIVCLSYDGKHKLTAEDITNMNRAYPGASFEETLYVQTPEGRKEVKIAHEIEYLEIHAFIVIEKSVRNRKHQVSNTLLAIAPYMDIVDPKSFDKIGYKLLCWFILPK